MNMFRDTSRRVLVILPEHYGSGKPFLTESVIPSVTTDTLCLASLDTGQETFMLEIYFGAGKVVTQRTDRRNSDVVHISDNYAPEYGT